MEDVELEIAAQAPSEAERVSGWRLDVLLEAGYPHELAEAVAASRADLHTAVRIVSQGCPHELAAQILV